MDLDAAYHLDGVDDAREVVPYLLVFVDLVARHCRTDRHAPIGIVADFGQFRDVFDVDYRVKIPPVRPRLYQYVRPAGDRSRPVAVLVQQRDGLIDRPGGLICKGMQKPAHP